MYRLITEFPDSETETAWRDLLKRADVAAHYCAPEYFSEPFPEGRKRFAIAALERRPGRDLAFTGILTGFREGQWLQCGRCVAPQMAVDSSGNEEEAVQSLLEGLLESSTGSRLLTVYTWRQYSALVSYGFRERPDMGTVIVDLSGGTEAAFAACTMRRSIRAAIHAGVEVREATDDDVPGYYEILTEWSRLKGLPCYSLDVCRQLFRLRSNRRLLLAFHEGRMLAGSVIRFLPGGIVEYAANSSRPETRDLRPNDLLMWRSIEWACQNGYRTFSMGGTHQFLQKFGGSVVPVYRYRLDRSWLRLPECREAALAGVYALYKRLPVPLRSRIARLRRG